MAGSYNDTIYGSNINLSGGQTPSLTADGQLLIGSTALNVGGTHVSVGTLSSSDGSITITNGPGTIDIKAAAGVVTETLTPDTGGAISPVAGNIDILGYDSGSFSLMDTHKTAAGQMKVENRTWLTPLVVDSSSTVGSRGTFSTIASAITAASSGQTIFIRPGTYTEDLTLKAGVDLVGFESGGLTPEVTIIGKLSASYSGSVTVSGVRLQTNADNIISLTGANATILNIRDCYLNITNNTAIACSGSNANAAINIVGCNGDITTTGIALFAVTDGTLAFLRTVITNTGSSTTANTISADLLTVGYSTISNPTTTSSTAVLLSSYSQFSMPTNNTAITHGGASSQLLHSRVFSGSASAISVSGGSVLAVYHSIVGSTNTNTITGAGEIQYSAIAFNSTSSGINATTQTPVTIGPLVKFKALAGGYVQTAISYNVLISDWIIGVTSTAAVRTITMPASGAIAGQHWIIKDESGGAAANPIVVAAGTGTIDGAASVTIPSNYGSISVYFNGTNYFVV